MTIASRPIYLILIFKQTSVQINLSTPVLRFPIYKEGYIQRSRLLIFLPLILFSLILPGIKYINAKLKQIHLQITLFIICRAERISLSITSSKRVNWSFHCFILTTTKGSNALCWPGAPWPVLPGTAARRKGWVSLPWLQGSVLSLTMLTQPREHRKDPSWPLLERWGSKAQSQDFYRTTGDHLEEGTAGC